MTCVLLHGSWTGSEHLWIEGSEPGHGLYLQIVIDLETDGAGKLQLKCKMFTFLKGFPENLVLSTKNWHLQAQPWAWTLCTVSCFCKIPFFGPQWYCL